MTSADKQSAKFVFRGTVGRVKAANVKAVVDKDHTAVVHIDEIVSAPQALAGFGGQDVTVQLAKGERVKAGQQAIFYTNGWIFGENLAVQSVGHDSVQTAPAAIANAAVAAAAPGAPADPARAAHHREIRARAEAAPMVLSGTVVAVGEPGPPAGAGMVGAALGAGATADAATPPLRRPISEHDPFWKEAVVEVKQVHKGAAAPQRVVVRFPQSSDVRWYRAPKFQVGQEGVFILHPDDGSVTGQPTAGVAAAGLAPQAETFTCLNAADFQPADHQSEVAAAVAAAQA